MASHGQRFNSYNPNIKQEILNKYFSNQGTQGSLAKEYGISRNTIKTWIAKNKLGIDISVDHRPGNTGRHKKNEDIDYKERYEILKNYQAFLKAQREKK